MHCVDTRSSVLTLSPKRHAPIGLHYQLKKTYPKTSIRVIRETQKTFLLLCDLPLCAALDLTSAPQYCAALLEWPVAETCWTGWHSHYHKVSTLWCAICQLRLGTPRGLVRWSKKQLAAPKPLHYMYCMKCFASPIKRFDLCHTACRPQG